MGLLLFLSTAVALFFGFWNGTLEKVSVAALSEAEKAVSLSLELLGSLCLWSGLMNAAEKCGLSAFLGRAVRPVLGVLFPRLKNDETTLGLLSMNVTANLLGLGNAATAPGLAAMKALRRRFGGGEASLEMVLFTVMNTASLQILPTTVATLRAAAGAEKPLDILPAVWLTSAAALLVGLSAAKATFPGEKP